MFVRLEQVLRTRVRYNNSCADSAGLTMMSFLDADINRDVNEERTGRTKLENESRRAACSGVFSSECVGAVGRIGIGVVVLVSVREGVLS